MKKITELTETRWRTIYLKDGYGDRIRTTEEYVAKRQVKTPSSGIRFTHFLIDGLLFQAFVSIVILFFFFLTLISDYGLFLFQIVQSIFIVFLYPALYTFFEYNWQKSPAKFLTKTRVIDEFNNPPDLRTIMLRSLIRLTPFEFLSWLDSDAQGWHEKWSKTWVVTEDEHEKLKSLQIEQSKNM